MVYREPTKQVEHDDLEWDFAAPVYQTNPYNHYRWCRENDPVHRVELPNGNVVYMLTKYADIKAAEMNHKTFSANVTDDVGWILFMDPPDHTRIRGKVQSHFSRRTLEEIDKQVVELNARHFQYLLDSSGGDTVSYCKHFPVDVVAVLFGIEADHEQLEYWILCTLKSMAAQFGLPGREEDHEGHREFIEFLEARIRDYIDNPQNNIGSVISNYAKGDSEVTVREIADFMNVMFAGGHETTTLTLSSAFGILAEDEKLFARIKQDRSLIPNFVEETLRYRPVLQSNGRITTEDIEVRGVTIPKGTIVKLCTGSGNMDEEVFEHPEEFNIDRPNVRDHLSFSRGVHACLGSVLARRELNIALEHVFDKVSSLRLDPDKPVVPHVGGTGNEHGFDSVSVIIEPAPETASANVVNHAN